MARSESLRFQNLESKTFNVAKSPSFGTNKLRRKHCLRIVRRECERLQVVDREKRMLLWYMPLLSPLENCVVTGQILDVNVGDVDAFALAVKTNLQRPGRRGWGVISEINFPCTNKVCSAAGRLVALDQTRVGRVSSTVLQPKRDAWSKATSLNPVQTQRLSAIAAERFPRSGECKPDLDRSCSVKVGCAFAPQGMNGEGDVDRIQLAPEY
jgi:hypothetical protein